MKTNSRFIKNVIKTSAADAPKLPFARGARRAAFIAKRTAPLATQRAA